MYDWYVRFLNAVLRMYFRRTIDRERRIQARLQCDFLGADCAGEDQPAQVDDGESTRTMPRRAIVEHGDLKAQRPRTARRLERRKQQQCVANVRWDIRLGHHGSGRGVNETQRHRPAVFIARRPRSRIELQLLRAGIRPRGKRNLGDRLRGENGEPHCLDRRPLRVHELAGESQQEPENDPPEQRRRPARVPRSHSPGAAATQISERVSHRNETTLKRRP